MAVIVLTMIIFCMFFIAEQYIIQLIALCNLLLIIATIV